MKFPAASIVLLTLAASVFPQSAAESYGRIRKLLDSGNYNAAVAGLRYLRAEQPSVFAVNNFDYLLGRTLEEMGDTAGAMKSFETVRSQNSVLKVYALWHLTTLARASGNLFLERLYLNEITAFADRSLIAEAARWRLAEGYLDSGDYSAAIRRLHNFWPDRSLNTVQSCGAAKTDKLRKLTALLAKAKMLAGETNDARRLFEELLAGTPNAEQPDDYALAAVTGLDVIDSESSTALTLTSVEHLRRAAVYRFNREFENARVHYLAVLNAAAADPVPKMVFEIGRTYSQEGNFVEAVKWFERGREQTADPAAAKDSLLQAASAYARLGKHREAITRYQIYIDKYPDDERIDRAYLNIIDALRDEGEETAAIQWARKAQQLFRGKLPEALALFSETRIYIARNDWEKTLIALERLRSFTNLGGASVPGGTNTTEIEFLRGFALEQRGRFSEAIDVYLSIPDGRNEYYAWHATERLQLLALQPLSKPAVDAKFNDLTAAAETLDLQQRRHSLSSALRLAAAPETRGKLLDSITSEYSRIPAYAKNLRLKMSKAGRSEVIAETGKSKRGDRSTIADELIFLGLFDEAAPEFEANLLSGGALADRPLSNDLAYTLGVLYARGNRGDRSAALAQKWWNLPGDYQVELLDPQLAQYIYPAPYKDALLRNTASRGVDPRFLLSIIRQESGFRPNVKSDAAARGLMQFISTTARTTASELGLTDFRNDDLFDPETSILFGSRYTEKLFTIFPELPDAVAAAYNGGEDNMSRWLARSKSRQPERYVAEIAFAQSKDYVYRVMSNYRMYQLLYDENLNLRADVSRQK